MKIKAVIMYLVFYVSMVGGLYAGFVSADKYLIKIINPIVWYVLIFVVPLFVLMYILVERGKKSVSTMTSEKQKATYPPVNRRYLSKKPDGFILGRVGSNYVRVPLDPENIMHAVVIGSPGSGKSAGPYLSTLISNFMQKAPPMQVFCLDIKPELAQKSVELRGNPNVRVVNPTDRNSWGWDVFYNLRSGATETEIVRELDGIARALIVTENEKNAFFSNSARNIFIGLMAYYYQKNMGFIEGIQQIMSENIKTQIQNLLTDKEHCPEHCRVRQYLAEYCKEGDERESDALQDIMMTLKEHLNIFTDPDVIWNLRDNPEKACPIDLNNDMSIFISIPEVFLGYGNALLRLYVHQVIEYCEKHRTEASRPLLMVLDEFARIGKIERIKDGLATLRSRRVSIWLAYQDQSQLESVYSQAARTILNLTEIRVICSCSDPQTIDTLSKWAGYYKETRRSYSKGAHARSTSISYENKKIIEAADVMTLREDGEVILFLEGRYYRVKRCRYYEDKVLNRRAMQVKKINMKGE